MRRSPVCHRALHPEQACLPGSPGPVLHLADADPRRLRSFAQAEDPEESRGSVAAPPLRNPWLPVSLLLRQVQICSQWLNWDPGEATRDWLVRLFGIAFRESFIDVELNVPLLFSGIRVL